MENSSNRSEVLVDSKWLHNNLDNSNIKIVEVDVSPTSYNEGHIPGAVLWNIYSDLKDEQYHLRGADEIQTLIQRTGIQKESTVVFYGYAPAIGFWLMKLYGHEDVRILNASKDAWKNNGFNLVTDPTEIPQSEYVVEPEDTNIRVLHEDLKHSLEQKDQTIIDVRTKAEFDGERFWPSGGIPKGTRAGRIPTALHLPVDGLVKEDGSFMSGEELEALFSDIDLTNNNPLITYCTIGARAATAWFALTQLLGYENAQVYDGSWARWGSDTETPIAAETFPTSD